MQKILVGEVIGTAVLVLGGVGTAVLADGNLEYGFVALAFGLSLLCAAYLTGHLSGCHVNPAVTIAMLVSKKITPIQAVWYWGSQVVGAFLGAGILFFIASGRDGFDVEAGFGSNSYSTDTVFPGGYALGAVAAGEFVFTFLFALVVMGTTRKRFPAGFGPVAAGLMLTLVHLVMIPVSGTSVNPARSLAPAVFAGGDYLTQVWVFILFPLLGGAVAGLVHQLAFSDDDANADADA